MKRKKKTNLSEPLTNGGDSSQLSDSRELVPISSSEETT